MIEDHGNPFRPSSPFKKTKKAPPSPKPKPKIQDKQTKKPQQSPSTGPSMEELDLFLSEMVSVIEPVTKRRDAQLLRVAKKLRSVAMRRLEKSAQKYSSLMDESDSHDGVDSAVLAEDAVVETDSMVRAVAELRRLAEELS
jgi:hypothetical protein